jgi:hypothetical protein
MRGYTLEKHTIIDEIFEETKTYIEETAEMKIETITGYQNTPENCSKCGRALDELYCRSEYTDCSVDLVIFECKDCISYFAYWILDSYPDPIAEQTEEGVNSTAHSFPFKNNNPKKIPKKAITEYSKSIALDEERTKELNRLIEAKLPQLYNAGLSLATVNFARNKMSLRLKNKKTSSKGLTKLVAGAVHDTANGVTWEGSSLWKHQGEGITEENVEAIFGVTRKTIRKWARTFEQARAIVSSMDYERARLMCLCSFSLT